jgi:hypothetical protein
MLLVASSTFSALTASSGFRGDTPAYLLYAESRSFPSFSYTWWAFDAGVHNLNPHVLLTNHFACAMNTTTMLHTHRLASAAYYEKKGFVSA